MTRKTSFDARENPFGPFPVVHPQHYAAHKRDTARVAALLAAGRTLQPGPARDGRSSTMRLPPATVTSSGSSSTRSTPSTPRRTRSMPRASRPRRSRRATLFRKSRGRSSPGCPLSGGSSRATDQDHQVPEPLPRRHKPRRDGRRPARLHARDHSLLRHEDSAPPR